MAFTIRVLELKLETAEGQMLGDFKKGELTFSPVSQNRAMLYRYPLPLCINITHWLPTDSIQQLPDSPRLYIEKVHLNQIIQPCIPTRRPVSNRDGSRDRLRLIQMQRLPDPPDIIQHSMVHEKHGVDRTCEKIARLTANRVVASAMHAQEALSEAALQLVLECRNASRARTQRDVEEIVERQPRRCCVRAQVALRAARVVRQCAVGVWNQTLLRGTYGAQVD
jgi:hypothetical protein